MLAVTVEQGGGAMSSSLPVLGVIRISQEGSEEKVGNGHAREDIVNSLSRYTRFSQRY